MLLSAVLASALVFTAKQIDLGKNRVYAETMFPVQLELEPMTPETTAKGEVLTECKLVKVKIDNPDDNPFHLECKGHRKFRIKAIRFTEAGR